MRDEQFTLIGRQPVLEAYRSGQTVDRLFVQEGLREGTLSSILREATRSRLEEWAAPWPEAYVWLGTNAANERAQRAYRRLGFRFQGQRTFRVGDQDNRDAVFARPIRMA